MSIQRMGADGANQNVGNAMIQVYSKTATLLLMIGLGYWMKQAGRLGPEDTRMISDLVIHITLPCVIIKNLYGVTLSLELLAAALLGCGANLLLLVIAVLPLQKQDVQRRLAALFSVTTFNITNYAVPILSSFTGAEAMVGVFAFNLPTSIFTYAIIPTCAGIISSERQKGEMKAAYEKLIHSTPTLTCICMFLLAALHISLPQPVIQIASSISDANTFLSMLAVGSLAELSNSWKEVRSGFLLIAVRLCAVSVMAALVYNLALVEEELRRALVMALFSPAASCCPMLAFSCGYEGNQIATVNSIYLLISVGILSFMTFFLY